LDQDEKKPHVILNPSARPMDGKKKNAKGNLSWKIEKGEGESGIVILSFLLLSVLGGGGGLGRFPKGEGWGESTLLSFLFSSPRSLTGGGERRGGESGERGYGGKRNREAATTCSPYYFRKAGEKKKKKKKTRLREEEREKGRCGALHRMPAARKRGKGGK